MISEIRERFERGEAVFQTITGEAWRDSLIRARRVRAAKAADVSSYVGQAKTVAQTQGPEGLHRWTAAQVAQIRDGSRQQDMQLGLRQ